MGVHVPAPPPGWLLPSRVTLVLFRWTWSTCRTNSVRCRPDSCSEVSGQAGGALFNTSLTGDELLGALS